MRAQMAWIGIAMLAWVFAAPWPAGAQSALGQSVLGQSAPAVKPPVVAAPASPSHAKPVHKKATVKHPEGKPAHPAGKPQPKPVVAPAAGVPAPVVAPVAPAADAPPPGPQFVKGSVTGFVLPRFAALKSDKVNMRAGPGTRYQIDWLYQRPYLPVRIEREFDVWRLVVDSEGVKGWVHSANLTGRRSFEIIGAERALRGSASADASVVARLMPGVVGHIVACEANAGWCRVESGGYEGWLQREDFWGTFPGEAVP